MGRRMLRLKETCVLLLLGVALGADAQIENCLRDSILPKTVDDSVKIEDFGLRLFRVTSAGRPNASDAFVMSPFSVWSALTTAYLGSDGATKTQLGGQLGLNSRSSAYVIRNELKFLFNQKQPGFEVRLFDWAFFSDGLRVRECMLRVMPNAEVLDLTDPASATLINDRVSEVTSGRIKKLVEPSSLANAVFALVSAIFFRGSWMTEFDPQETQATPFHDRFGSQVATVDMMHRIGDFRYTEISEMPAQVVELPYEGNNVYMYIFLPRENVSWLDVIKYLDSRNLKYIGSQMARVKLSLFLPRFNTETMLDTEIKQALQVMGVSDLFDWTRSDLTGFSANTTLAVDSVIQKATIEVSEEGTVAAAATALIGVRFGGGRPLPLKCDRPFVYLIRDRTTEVTLFSGLFAAHGSSA